MHITSFPGFDTITPTFIKCAYKRHGRGSENVNVTAPHIAALFSLLIEKAHIPRSWKEAKPTAICFSITSLENYGMIAVSGTLYRLYGNLLRSIVQDWRGQHV